MPPRPRIAHPHHRVTAVVVSHDGARWLPEVLAALAAQARGAQRVVAVDTGSTDGSLDLLVAALGAERVVEAPRDTGYGDAVRLGLDHVGATAPFGPLPRRRDTDAPPREPVDWVWLLHHDSPPERATLPHP